MFGLFTKSAARNSHFNQLIDHFLIDFDIGLGKMIDYIIVDISGEESVNQYKTKFATLNDLAIFRLQSSGRGVYSADQDFEVIGSL